jgi:hypothetical protein
MRLLKLFKPVGTFFKLLLESVGEARKARADAITRGIGR